MRLLVATAFALGALSFTSCSETQPQGVAAPSSAKAEAHADTESHGHAASHSAIGAGAENAHGAAHGETAQAHSGDHADHGVSHAAHPADAHSPTAAHDDSHHAHGNHSEKARAHSSHHHAANAHETHDDGKSIAVGDKVPDFEVTIAGRKWTLSELQQNKELTPDGTLVLTFWCSFCHSCRHVEHSLDALAKQYHGQAGVVALDASAGETTESVAKFAKKRELTLPIALDATGSAADLFGTRVTTTTVVIDKDGVLRYRGQFGDGEHTFAQDALRAVLAGDDVPVQETRQKG